MKIDAMVEREDFYPILEKTLTKYYREVLKRDCTVEVTDSPRKENVIIFEKLNRIITRHPSKQIRQSIYESFNINDNTLKRIAAKIYIFLLLSTGRLLADKGLRLSDQSMLTNNQAVIPGNKKIRINNYKTKTSDLIVKEGFADTYFQNELRFRTENIYDFIVPILEHGDYWYREQLIDGLCLARVTDKAVYEKAAADVVACLRLLYEEYGMIGDAREYAEKLKHGILVKLQQICIQKTDIAFDSDAVIALTEKLADRAMSLERIPLTCSHGDMQSGNVMVDKTGKILIIDWESYGQRSIWYDVVTFFLFTRRLNRWRGIIQKRFSADEQDIFFMLDSSRMYDVDAVISVIILEDLDFKLTDTLMIPGALGCSSLNSFINEISEDGLL